jgi:hypothetical protein
MRKNKKYPIFGTSTGLSDFDQKPIAVGDIVVVNASYSSTILRKAVVVDFTAKRLRLVMLSVLGDLIPGEIVPKEHRNKPTAICFRRDFLNNPANTVLLPEPINDKTRAWFDSKYHATT